MEEKPGLGSGIPPDVAVPLWKKYWRCKVSAPTLQTTASVIHRSSYVHRFLDGQHGKQLQERKNIGFAPL